MNNVLEDQIRQITVEAKEMFLKKTDRLFQERVEKEHSLARQYCGREILELLQNIDDAYNPACGKPCVAEFTLEDRCLTVSNYGNPFTIESLQRLCQGSVSSKEGKYIGSKGIGFRSVLNWSEKVEIYSHAPQRDYIAVGFSREAADSVYQEIKEEEHIKNQIEELKRKGIDPSFPIFKAPVPIKPIEGLEYNTVIKIYVRNDDSNVEKTIKKEIEQFDKNTLLFLPNIQIVKFKCSNKESVYQKSKEPTNRVAITFNEGEPSDYYYFEDNDQTITSSIKGSNNIRMAIAIPCTETNTDSHLYSFFPVLNIPSPFNALLHATFSLNANRNNLEPSQEDDRVNREVFTKLLEFYVSKVVTLDLKERAIKLLTPKSFGTNYKFPGDLARLNVEEFYFDKCRHTAIFYSINKEYLNASESSAPCIIDNIPQTFAENSLCFNRLVIIDKAVKPFAQEILTDTKLETEKYLLDVINSKSSTWPSSDRIQVFKWWAEMGYPECPKLIKDSKNNFIESSNNTCFISGHDKENTINDVPEWADICIINKDDEQELINQYKDQINEYRETNNSSDSTARILPRLLNKKYINLQEQSSKQVMISPVNKSINGDFNRAVHFIEWLWKIWEQQPNLFSSSLKADIDFYVPTTKNTARRAKETYIGAGLNNELGAKLFSAITDSFDEVYKISDIKDERQYSLFLLELGVNKYPSISEKIETVNLGDDKILNRYINYVKHVHSADSTLNVSSWEVKVSSILSFEKILNSSNTEDIIKWIWNDDQLKRIILVGEETESSYIKYKPRRQGQQYYYSWNNGWKLPSFLGFVLSTTAWIKIGDKKYAPDQLMISSETHIEYCEDIPCISEISLENIAQNAQINYDDLKLILQKLGIKESYIDLNSDQFYTLLTKLGDNDCEKSRKISREIYRAIIDNNRGSGCAKTGFFADSENKKLFFQKGKVLAKNRTGKVAYIHCSNVYFSSSAVINLDDVYFIDVPPRSGNKNSFERILGIKPYNQKYSVLKPEISPLDQDFQSDFKSFLPYLLAYRTGNKDTMSLSIHLVSSISIMVNDNIQNVCLPYSLFEESKSKWFIYIGKNSLSYESINKCKIGELLEQVFNVYYNFPSKDFLGQVTRLFICNKAQRQYFVESEFGSSYEYDMALKEIRHSEELKQGLISFLSIDENDKLVSSINSIDWSDLQNENVQEKILTLVKETGKSLAEFSNVLSLNLSVSNFNKSALMKAYRIEFEKIRSNIYSFCKDTRNYGNLCSLWDSISKKVEEYNPDNDVNFDAAAQLNLIVEEFYNEKGISTRNEENLTAIHKLYESQKKEAICIVNKRGLDLNDFTNDAENNSLLYFEESGWMDKIKLFVKNSQQEDNNTCDVVKEDTNVHDIIDSIIWEYKLENGECRHKPLHTSNGGGVTEKSKRKQESDNKARGNRAEYYVILALSENKIQEVNDYFGKEGYSIIWKSGAANEIIKADGDKCLYDTSQINDGAGYDIELIAKDDQEKKMYIEVKSSTSRNCSFFMSKNEYDTAIRLESANSEYRIVFVAEECDRKYGLSFINAPVKDVFEILPTEYNVIFNKDRYSQIVAK